MRLAIHADAHALDSRRAYRDERLSGRHHGLRQIHHHAGGRVKVLSFGDSGRWELISTRMSSVLADYVDSIELARCLGGRAPTSINSIDTNWSVVAFAFRLSPPAGLARVSFLDLQFDTPGFRSRRPA